MEKGRTATVCQPLPDPRSRSARSSLGRTVSFGSRGCAEHLKGGRAATNWPGPTGTMCYWEDQRLAAVGALCGIALGVALLLRQVNWPGVWHPLGVAARSCLHWLRFRAGLRVRAGSRCDGLSTRCVLALARMLGHEDPSLTLRT